MKPIIPKLRQAISSLKRKIKDKRDYLKTVVTPKQDVLELKNQTKQLYTKQSKLNRLLFLHSYFSTKKEEKNNGTPPT
jgi:hypothetical protein